ncbi:hypothetical protein GG344DRAFT_51003, partial [Lentinula edodes]
NSNVVELYSRLVKNKTQLTYYNSGIGTYARPSWTSWSYLKQVFNHTVDMAIAWNFERIVLSAYQWLSENYEDGDQIFLFGFSRGAYQVRVIAGMIERVGLLHKGNNDQIPFAYELYSATVIEGNYMALARHFKEALSRPEVKVHFVGAWDTVSSIGIARGPTLPETTTGMKHVNIFRHALALDERRVKFLPEFVNGGLGPADKSLDDSKIGNNVKEVWFAGSHSDIGGGNTYNPGLDRFGPALRWMTYEAISHGLKMDPFRGEWTPLDVNESLTGFWKLLEFIPFRRLTYEDKSKTIKWQRVRPPHNGRPRGVQRGQLVHESVIMKQKETPSYVPMAHLFDGIKWEETSLENNHLVEKDPYLSARTILSELQDADSKRISESYQNVLITLTSSGG